MSLYTPPAWLSALLDGDTFTAGQIKEIVAGLQDHLNGKVGNTNINTALDSGEKIAYAKLALAGAILDADIAGVSISKFTTLKAKAQTVQNNTVIVQDGAYLALDGTIIRTHSSASSPAFPNTGGAGLNRIDLLTITDGGVLTIVPGVDAASPVAPSYPLDQVPICEVYVRYSGTGVVIYDADNSVDSYISKDARPFLRFTEIPDGSVSTAKIVDGAVTTAKLAAGNLIGRTDSESHIAGALGLTYAEKPERELTLATATDEPCGRGAERGGFVYFPCRNANKLVKWNHATGAEAAVALAASDAPGDLVRVGTDLYVICNGTFKVKKVDASDVVTTAVDLTADGPAAGAWTLVNAITRNGAGTVLFTLSKITGTYVSRLLRVTPSPASVTHAWDYTAGRYLAMPCFVKTSAGTEYVIVFGHSNPGGTATPALNRLLALDLTYVDAVNAGPATQALGAQIPLGCDGQFYYVFDTSTTPDCIRIFDVLAATMYEAGRIELPAVTWSPTVIDTVDLADSVSGNRYPFFDGYRILFGGSLSTGIRPILCAVPVPAWGGSFKIKLGDTASMKINGFATDGLYTFVAISNGATSGASLSRILL